jgi:CRISPR system Cascade subunit CasA
MVLTFQNFAPGSPAGFVKWNGERVDRYCKPGVCCEGIMHSLVRGDALAESIHWNLLTRSTINTNYGKPFGKPLWETPPSSRADTTNAANTYLGRLVPLARSLLISQDKQTVTIGNGLVYPRFSKKFEEFPQEPTATVIAVDKGTAHDLLKDTGKAVWRELDALAVSRREGQAGGALALANIPEEVPFDLWVGGLVTIDASVVDGFESVTNVPAGMLTSPVRSAYRMAVEEAETWERKLEQAVKKWREIADFDKKGHGKLKRAASRHYWAAVEQGLPYVHAYLRQEGESAQLSYKQWAGVLKAAAIAGYKAVCGCTTPRQIRAFAVGISTLDPSKRPKSKANTKKNQNA